MSLSVCCLTRDSPPAVAAMLSLFRAVADDLVVAVDARVDTRLLGPLLEVADTVVRFEYGGTPERARPWLVAQCRHDHVLMVDGDEIPSAALLAALPELVADDHVRQFRIARRWCFPDERHWLAERPWWPDFQRRLLRQGPRLDFDLRFHGGVRGDAPSRHVMEPLYHLNCVTKGFAERRREASGYETERPGEMAVGGGSLNSVLYAPEHFATRRLEPTPHEDLVVLRAVLGAGAGEELGGPAAAVRVVSAAEIAEHVPPDPLDAQGYRAHLAVVEHDRRTDPGNDTTILVAVTNLGLQPIPHEDGRGVQVRLAARLLDASGAAVAGDWVRTRLPCDIPAGATRLAEAVVRIPALAGRYVVEVDLLNERSRWFGCATTSDLVVATRWGRFTV